MFKAAVQVRHEEVRFFELPGEAFAQNAVHRKETPKHASTQGCKGEISYQESIRSGYPSRET